MKSHVCLIARVLLFLCIAAFLHSCADSRPIKSVTKEGGKEEPILKNYVDFEPIWEHPIDGTLAFKQANTIWETFREKFPYHIQIIAVQKFEDDSYLFILSEPPNNVGQGKVLEIFNRYNRKYWGKRKKIGVDGYTKDAVIAVTDIPKLEFNTLIKRLNILLFQTDYKSDYYLNLPASKGYVAFAKEELNLDITGAELQSWFIEQNEEILSENGRSTNLSSALKASSQLYKSKIPGFYFLVMARSSDPADYKEKIRKFALDTDLIIGAVAGQGSIALIGREREVGLSALPPLRVETIIQLAAANKDELAQSYERNMLLAGKLESGKDWAPIYLSEELINTEYGSLLNLTDQMLKSWSLNGAIEYENWGHKQPKKWGFLGGGVMDELDVTNLTFNWNTTGAVYNVPYGSYEVIGFNRTGSLPVSYFPEGLEDTEMDEETIETAEETGYNFFSQLNNPDLVRVSQYAGIYQIFSNYGIQSDERLKNGKKPSRNPLARHYTNLYRQILELSSTEISELGEKVEVDFSNEIVKLQNQLEETENEEEYDSLTYSMLLLELIKESSGETMVQNLDTLQKSLRLVSEYFEIEEIASLNANPREIGKHESEEKAYASFFISETFSEFFDDTILDYLSMGKDKVMSDYIKGYEDSKSDWIKTPSIVLSWSKRDSAFSVGGHNLESKMTNFRIDRSLAPGKYRVEDINGIKVVYSSSPNIDPRTLRRLSKSEGGVITLGTDEFTSLPIRNRKDVFPNINRDRGLNDSHIPISRNGDHLVLDDQKFENYDDFIDALKDRMTGQKGQKVELRFERFSEDEVQASLISSDFRLNLISGRLKSFRAQERLNFKGYTITKSANGASIDVEIPKISGIGSVKLKISRISQEIGDAIVRAIDKAMVKLIKWIDSGKITTNHLEEFKKTLRNELKAEGIDPDDLIFQEEFNDILISLLWEDLKRIYVEYA